MADLRRPLDATAAGAMIVMCALWGFQQVAIKLAAPAVLAAACRARSGPPSRRCWCWAGHAGAEFALVAARRHAGTGPRRRPAVRRRVRADLRGARAHDRGADGGVPLPRPLPHRARASRGSCRASGCALLQWTGVATGLRGHRGRIRRRIRGTRPRPTLLGDALGVMAAVGWAATTVLIRAHRSPRSSRPRALFYQLAVSAALLPLFSLATPRTRRVIAVDAARGRQPRVPGRSSSLSRAT